MLKEVKITDKNIMGYNMSKLMFVDNITNEIIAYNDLKPIVKNSMSLEVYNDCLKDYRLYIELVLKCNKIFYEV